MEKDEEEETLTVFDARRAAMPILMFVLPLESSFDQPTLSQSARVLSPRRQFFGGCHTLWVLSMCVCV